MHLSNVYTPRDLKAAGDITWKTKDDVRKMKTRLRRYHGDKDS